MIKEYVRKPVVLKAVEWTGDNLNEITDIAIGLMQVDTYNDLLFIFTTHNAKTLVRVGDIVVRVEDGGCHVYRPREFEEKFEELNTYSNLSIAENVIREMDIADASSFVDIESDVSCDIYEAFAGECHMPADEIYIPEYMNMRDLAIRMYDEVMKYDGDKILELSPEENNELQFSIKYEHFGIIDISVFTKQAYFDEFHTAVKITSRRHNMCAVIIKDREIDIKQMLKEAFVEFTTKFNAAEPVNVKLFNLTGEAWKPECYTEATSMLDDLLGSLKRNIHRHKRFTSTGNIGEELMLSNRLLNGELTDYKELGGRSMDNKIIRACDLIVNAYYTGECSEPPTYIRRVELSFKLLEADTSIGYNFFINSEVASKLTMKSLVEEIEHRREQIIEHVVSQALEL